MGPKVQIFPSFEVTALTLLRNGLPAHPHSPRPAEGGGGGILRKEAGLVTVVPSGWSAPRGCAWLLPTSSSLYLQLTTRL